MTSQESALLDWCRTETKKAQADVMEVMARSIAGDADAEEMPAALRYWAGMLAALGALEEHCGENETR